LLGKLKRNKFVRFIYQIIRALRLPSYKVLEQLKSVDEHLSNISKTTQVIRHTVTAPHMDEVREFSAQRQLSFGETLKLVRDKKLSMARFGDGEFKTMLQSNYNLKFQKNSLALRNALRETIELGAAHPKKLLIGFPHFFTNDAWISVWSQVWIPIKKLFAGIKVVGDAHVSRPVYFAEDKDEAVAAWRSVWAGQRIAVITGKGSRFDLIPELFVNVKSSEFIWSKPTNAFEDLDRLIEEVKTTNFDLYLISLGPAGTVLAAKLALEGKWALDIGHISSSYLNVHRGEANPESTEVVR
jgi:hypothetical protein